MTREEKILKEGNRIICEYFGKPDIDKLHSFQFGARWADEYPKNPWISTRERLPERMTSRDSNGTKIIGCCSKDVFGYDASYKIGRLVCYNHESEMWESRDAYTIGEITYWMPIPETPKV